MKKARITIDFSSPVGEIDPKIYGSFIEHTGRCVYDGVYAPDTPAADEDGFNKHLVKECRDMKLPLVRYPGGSYVATWDWRNSIGPKSERKTDLNIPWHEIEPSTFGIGEMVEWSRKVGCEIMICLNLNTLSLLDNLHLLEYCNFPGGTYYSDLRRSHGYEEPFGIKYWSMGNEPDGWWQIDLRSADEYARISAETAKAFKWVDPSVEVIACAGFSSEWTVKTLKAGYKHYDYLSWHCYFANKENNFPAYMAKMTGIGKRINEIAEMCDRIGDELGEEKRLMISADEWNVWYHSLEQDKLIPHWELAPHRLEDIYNTEDALAVGSFLLTLLKHCDRVKLGSMAQLVNVIAPFFTNADGDLLKQSSFWTYRDVCLNGRGMAYTPVIDCPTFDAQIGESTWDSVPMLDSVATKDGDGLSFFILNRSETESLECSLDIGLEVSCIKSASLLYHPDIKAENSFDAPDNVSEKPLDVALSDANKLHFTMPEHSWACITAKTK